MKRGAAGREPIGLVTIEEAREGARKAKAARMSRKKKRIAPDSEIRKQLLGHFGGGAPRSKKAPGRTKKSAGKKDSNSSKKSAAKARRARSK